MIMGPDMRRGLWEYYSLDGTRVIRSCIVSVLLLLSGSKMRLLTRSDEFIKKKHSPTERQTSSTAVHQHLNPAPAQITELNVTKQVVKSV